jgi:hypothetical protein
MLIVIAVYIVSWALFLWAVYNLDWASWWQALLWAMLPTALVAALGYYLYLKHYNKKLTQANTWFILGVLIVGVATPLILKAGNVLTLAPPGPGPTPVITIENATLQVQILGQLADIGGLCEVKLYKATDWLNWSTWTEVNIQGNWSGTEFYHNGWLNANMFNSNLSKMGGSDYAWYVKTQAWWKLSEWAKETYTPPTWWFFSFLTATQIKDSEVAIALNETGLSWTRIGSGVNTIEIVSVPWTLYGKIENSASFDRWNSSDNAYSDNYISNWQISISPPLNESLRGYKQTYDYQTGQYFGCWLIASSNDEFNINDTYDDSYGDTKLRWFNITQGVGYKGAIFNDSIVVSQTHEIAILLPTFNYDWSFKTNIEIKNGSAGITWYLGGGFENNIQIIRAL